MSENIVAKHGGRFKDLTGLAFGRLTVVEFAGKYRNKDSMWRCLCECGRNIIVIGFNLGRGVKSCGCLNRELSVTRKTKHGKSGTREFGIWRTMLSRCSSPNSIGWDLYGGRGIKVCERWHEFANFIADMGPRPTNSHTLDRIDGNGDYCPENCRWATMQEQANNTRRNVRVIFEGKVYTISELARKTGVDYKRLQRRIKRGYSVEDALYNQPWARQKH